MIPDCVRPDTRALLLHVSLDAVDSLNVAVHDSQFDLVLVFSHLLRTLRAQEEMSSCTSDASCEVVDQQSHGMVLLSRSPSSTTWRTTLRTRTPPGSPTMSAATQAAAQATLMSANFYKRTIFWVVSRLWKQ